MEIVRCRCCLNPKTAVYYPLSSILTDLPGGVQQTILKTLQIVTSSNVVLSDILPNEICEPCLLNLKVTYKFIVTFNESQELLKTLEQQIDDGVNVTDNFNNCVLPTSPVKEENLLESSTVQNLNNGLLDHNYYNISQIQSEADDDNEENVTGITIMTIEDVLEEEKKRRKRKMNEGDITKVSTVQNEIKTEVVGRSSNVKRERSEGEPGAYKCDICNMIYQSRTRLTRHKYSMHNENWMEVFKCSVCGESYDTSSKLRHHKESNHQDTVFICYLCGKVCRIKQHLRLHIQQRHSNPDQYKHLCPQCGRRFRSYCSLKYHLKQHDNIKNFVCRFCGFRSSSSCGLTRHERTHTGEKPYLCRFCPKQFSGKGDLKRHEDTHTGVRPYKCSYCPQTFTRTYNKKKHMMQHSGEYGCQMCKRKFIDLDVLKFHYHVKHRIVFDSSDADSKVKIENMIVAES